METLTTSEVAELLGISRMTVTRMLNDGRLSTREGRSIAYRVTPVSPRKIRRDLLELYLQEQDIEVDWSILDQDR